MQNAKPDVRLLAYTWQAKSLQDAERHFLKELNYSKAKFDETKAALNALKQHMLQVFGNHQTLLKVKAKGSQNLSEGDAQVRWNDFSGYYVVIAQGSDTTNKHWVKAFELAKEGKIVHSYDSRGQAIMVVRKKFFSCFIVFFLLVRNILS